MRLTIIIDNQEADFFDAKDLVPAIYKQIIDFTDPFVVVGDYVLGFNLPATSKNQKILNYIGRLDVNTPFFDYPHTASIKLNDITLIKGSLEVLEYSSRTIKCKLIGDNISWAQKFSGKTLNQLDLGTVVYSGFRNDTYYPWKNQTPNTITAPDIWKTFEADGLYKFNVPLIAYGNFPVTIEDEDNPDTNTFTGNPIAYKTNPFASFRKIKDSSGYQDGAVFAANQIDSLFSLSNFPFAPYVKSTVKQIFNEAGYSVNGDWFSDSNTDDLLLPWTGETLPFISSLLSHGSAYQESVIDNWGPIADIGYPIPFNIINNQASIPAEMNEGVTFISISSEILSVTPGNPPTFNPPPGGLSNQPIYIDRAIGTSGSPLGFGLPGGIAVYNLMDSIINSTESYTGAFGPGPDGYFEGFSTIEAENYTNSLLFYGPYETTVPWAGDVTNARLGKCYLKANTSGTYTVNLSFRLTGIMSLYASLRPVITLVKNIENIDDVFIPVSSGDSNVFPSIYPDALNDTDLVLAADTINLQLFDVSQAGLQYFAGGYYTFNYSATLDLVEGDKLYLLMGVGLADDPSDSIPDNYYYFSVDNFNADIKRIDIPDTVRVADFLPQTDIIEFLKSIFNLFNLIPLIDENSKTATLIPRPTYFLPASTSIDWSHKTSIDTASLKPSNQIKFYNFQWNQVEDKGYTVGDFDYTFVNPTLSNQSETTISLMFAPTPDRTFKFFNNGGNFLTATLPSIADAESYNVKLSEVEADISYNFEPRILKWNGLQIYEDILYPMWIDGRSYSSADLFPDQYPQGTYILPMASFIDTGNSDFYLTYSDIPGTDKKSLYTKYWKPYIEFITNSYIISMDVLLNESDIANIDIRRPIKIGDQLFYINLIDGFRPILDSTTKVDLIKKINI